MKAQPPSVPKPPKPPLSTRIRSWKWWVYGDMHSQPRVKPPKGFNVQLAIAFAVCWTFYLHPTTVNANPLSEKNICLQYSIKDETYQIALNNLMRYDSVKRWEEQLKIQHKSPAVIHEMNKSVYINNRCFWKITLSESDGSRMMFWKEYYVRIAMDKSN